MKHKELITDAFRRVKALGFVKSNRKNNTGIGKTFEDYIGVVENNLDEPDLWGYEIKSHREEATSYVTLFTKSPSFPRRANAYLNSRYGMPYEANPALKKLHTSFFATRYNTFGEALSFRLINDHTARMVKIGVYDQATKALLDDSVGYTYDTLARILAKKLRNLFYVRAERKFEGEEEFFHFNKAEIYTAPSFDRFLELIDKGLIMYDIRIGCYQSGKNYGKPHDHGSGFRIIESNIKLLYDTHEEVA